MSESTEKKYWSFDECDKYIEWLIVMKGCVPTNTGCPYCQGVYACEICLNMIEEKTSTCICTLSQGKRECHIGNKTYHTIITTYKYSNKKEENVIDFSCTDKNEIVRHVDAEIAAKIFATISKKNEKESSRASSDN